MRFGENHFLYDFFVTFNTRSFALTLLCIQDKAADTQPGASAMNHKFPVGSHHLLKIPSFRSLLSIIVASRASLEQLPFKKTGFRTLIEVS